MNTHKMIKHPRKDGPPFWTTKCGLHVDPEFARKEMLGESPEPTCKLCLRDENDKATTVLVDA